MGSATQTASALTIGTLAKPCSRAAIISVLSLHLFYGIGAVVSAIIAITAYRLARGSNKRDPLLWSLCRAMLVATVWSQAELVGPFILAGLVVVSMRAWLGRRGGLLLIAAGVGGLGLIWGMATFLLGAETTAGGNVLAQILLFFTKAGAFVCGSGLAIVPFLQQGGRVI